MTVLSIVQYKARQLMNEIVKAIKSCYMPITKSCLGNIKNTSPRTDGFQE